MVASSAAHESTGMELLKVRNEPKRCNSLESHFNDIFLPAGTIDTVYDLLNCTVGPERNQDRSYLTFISPSGIMFGVINIVGKIIYPRIKLIVYNDVKEKVQSWYR